MKFSLLKKKSLKKWAVKMTILTGILAVGLSFSAGLTAEEAKAVDAEVQTSTDVVYPKKDYALKIMLDAGHYGNYYNRGIISGYYESKAVWTITEAMEDAFSDYYDVKVGKTRTDKYKDMDVVERGKKAKGYDLLVSNHSNACSVQSVDYPLVIVPFESKYYSDMYSLGKKIGYNIESSMGTRQDYKVKTETYVDYSGVRRNYYGIIRGASYAGVPGMIIEHSFHSNKDACRWLLKTSNLEKIGEKNADTIASFYGAKKKSTMKASLTVETTENKTNMISVPNTKSGYSYEIYCATDGERMKKIATLKGNGGKVKFEHKKPYKGKTVFYMVRPVSSKIIGKYSAPVGALIKDIGKPVLKAEQYEPGVVKLSWNAADSAEEYTITKKMGDEVIWSKTVDSDTLCFYDAEAKDGETYTYQVKAWGTDGINEYSKNSRKVEITAEAVLDGVTFSVASKSPESIRVTWEKVSGATSYNVYRSETKTGEYVRIGNRTGSVFTDKNLQENKRYYYKVKAVKNFKAYGISRFIYSKMSDPVSCRVMVTPPAKVTSLSLSSTKGKVTAKWKKVSGADGYRVAYRVKGGSYKYVNTTSLSKTLVSLKSKKIYQVKVRAYRTVDGRKGYGEWSTRKAITCK